MMLGDFLFERTVANGEVVRVALAVLGTAIASWYDVRNNKNVPDRFLYGFLAVAFLSSLVFFQQDVFIYGAAVALIIFAIGYAFYRLGYIGGADVYALAAIALLVPVFPSYINPLLNTPPVLSIIIYSGVLFSLYFLAFVALRIVLKGKKGRWEYLLLAPAYGILLYFLASSGVFSTAYLAVVSLLILASIVFLVYKQEMMKAMAERIALGKADEEDIAALELMPEEAGKYGIRRLLDSKELARLKGLGVKDITVYRKLPPFLPFVLAGLVLSVIFGDMMMKALMF